VRVQVRRPTFPSHRPVRVPFRCYYEGGFGVALERERVLSFLEDSKNVIGDIRQRILLLEQFKENVQMQC